MITQASRQRGGGRAVWTRVRIARISLIVLVMPMLIGCRNTEGANALAEANSANSVLEAKVVQLQNTVTAQESKIAEQDSQITTLSNNPKQAAWYEKFIAWLGRIFGDWASGKFVEWLEQFLSTL